MGIPQEMEESNRLILLHVLKVKPVKPSMHFFQTPTADVYKGSFFPQTIALPDSLSHPLMCSKLLSTTTFEQ